MTEYNIGKVADYHFAIFPKVKTAKENFSGIF